ncbi:MAG: FmdB family zinc ribbon protein [Bacillota bacterium]
MPIFEFRCVKCGKLFEKLFLNADEEIRIKCPDCGSEEADRVISRTNYAMGSGRGKKPQLTTKSCGPGSSCTTLELPGLGD